MLAVANILVKLFRELPPNGKRLHDHGHFARVSPLLAHPAPVATRLLAGDVALLAQGDGYTLLCEEPRGGNADNAAADDYDVRRRRDCG